MPSNLPKRHNNEYIANREDRKQFPPKNSRNTWESA